MKTTKRIFVLLCAVVILVQCFAITAAADEYPVLKKGSKGDYVKLLQTMLNRVQASGLAVDGSFGPATLAAVKTFQKSYNLTVDGIVGKNTWGKLVPAYTAVLFTNLRKSAGEGVSKLLTKGYKYTASGVIDSKYNLTNATLTVYDKTGRKLGQVSCAPGAKSYNFKEISAGLNLGQLEAGSYELRVFAKDAYGAKATVMKQDFTVATKTLTIGPGQYSPGTLSKGQEYTMNGTISSVRNVSEATVTLNNSWGKPVVTFSVKPGKYNYDISNLNSKIEFNKLSVGQYTLKVIAKDGSGTTKTLVNKSFKVVD